MKSKILNIISEVLLIFAILYYWSLTAMILNFVAITLIAILTLQLIYQNAIIGMLIGSLFFIISIYMLLALASELSEFTTFGTEAKKMLLIGGSYLGTTLILSIALFYKSKKLKIRRSLKLR